MAGMAEARLAWFRSLIHSSEEMSYEDKCELLAEVERARAEVARLCALVLTAAGDDLCRLSQDDIKAMKSGAVPIPPRDEFLASCGLFWDQTANENGVNAGCLTLAQLAAENERLRRFLSWAVDLIDMYDAELAKIDGPENVYTPTHVSAKQAARAAIGGQAKRRDPDDIPSGILDGK